MTIWLRIAFACAWLYLCSCPTQCSQTQELVIYYRAQLNYSFAQSEYFLSVLSEERDESNTSITDHHRHITTEIKKCLSESPIGRADCMALDHNKNSAMHLALMNKTVPSRSLIKLLLPATNWLEKNNNQEYAFDYFDVEKHIAIAPILLYDVIRSLCFRKKINFKQFYQCANQKQIYSVLREFFNSKERTSLTQSLTRVAHRKTYN